MWHHDVTNPRTCQFSAVCLTVFPFEFRPRTFTIGFSGKNSIISELMILECSFPLRGYKFKETKHDRFGKRPAATEAEEIDDRSTEADVNALRMSIEFFFFFFLRRRLTTLNLCFLL